MEQQPRQDILGERPLYETPEGDPIYPPEEIDPTADFRVRRRAPIKAYPTRSTVRREPFEHERYQPAVLEQGVLDDGRVTPLEGERKREEHGRYERGNVVYLSQGERNVEEQR